MFVLTVLNTVILYENRHPSSSRKMKPFPHNKLRVPASALDAEHFKLSSAVSGVWRKITASSKFSDASYLLPYALVGKVARKFPPYFMPTCFFTDLTSQTGSIQRRQCWWHLFVLLSGTQKIKQNWIYFAKKNSTWETARSTQRPALFFFLLMRIRVNRRFIR